jgi:hypothetical protein
MLARNKVNLLVKMQPLALRSTKRKSMYIFQDQQYANIPLTLMSLEKAEVVNFSLLFPSRISTVVVAVCTITQRPQDQARSDIRIYGTTLSHGRKRRRRRRRRRRHQQEEKKKRRRRRRQ